MSNDLTLSLILKAKDKMSNVIQDAITKSDADFEKLKKKIDLTSKSFADIGKKSVIAGGAMLAASGVNIKLAADFETGMANVSTLIDTNTENLQSMGDKVMDIGKKTPVALSDLTSALYDIRSAGIPANNQFTVLENSAKLGVAGLGSTAEAVDLVTSSFNAFGLKGKAANKVYDNIFKTVKFGKTTISGLAQGFGAVAGTVSAADIKLDEYLAAVAALTTTGQPASQAHTQLKAAIAGMTRESKESIAVLNSLGAKSFKDLVKKSGGMVNAFKLITQRVKGNDGAILKLFGSTEAYNAVVGLTGKQNNVYTETLHSMRYGADAVSEAFEKQKNTANKQMQRFQNLIQTTGITMGQYLLPATEKILTAAENLVAKFGELPKPVQKFISVGIAGLGVVLTAFGGLMLACSVVTKGIGSILTAGRWIIEKSPVILNFVGKFGKSFGWILNLGKFCTATFGTVVAVIAGIGLVIWKYWQPLKEFFGQFWEGLKAGLAPLAPLLVPVQNGFKRLGAFINFAIQPVQLFFRVLKMQLKDVFTPLDHASSGFKMLGATIGLTIGNSITWIVNLIKNIVVLAGKINDIRNGKPVKLTIEDFKVLPKWGNKTPIVDNNKNKKQQPKKLKVGLARVPFDNYPALLHAGERVLTSREANNYTQNSGKITVSYAPKITVQGGNATEFEAMLKQHANTIMRMVQEAQRRADARAYV